MAGWLALVGPGGMTLPLATEMMLRATAAVTAMMMTVPTAMLTPDRPPHMMMTAGLGGPCGTAEEVVPALNLKR